MSNNKQIVKDFFDRVYNKQDFDYVLEIFSTNYFEHTLTGARTNIEAIKILKSAFEVFPDLKVTIGDIIAEKNIVAVRVNFSGTPVKQFINTPPNNKIINWEAMEFFKLEHNKIIESWGSWPLFDIIEQMKEK
ncbi:MAG: hypothetical protein BKP49_00070 [Treponema sp. CETP13]|nr:MAG: hypothetical protein BKP49_00070 [Treponema sp. CETP13]